LATGGEVSTARPPVWDTALAWQDGGVPELKGIILPQEEALDDAVGIVRGKHNKSRSEAKTHNRRIERRSGWRPPTTGPT
jgi:hypothetical protein